MRQRDSRNDSSLWLLAKLGVAIAVVASVPLVVIPWHDEIRRQEWAAYEAEQAAMQRAYLQPFQQAFASGNRLAVLAQCSQAVDDSFSYVHPAQALAWADDRVDAYVYVSSPLYGLRRLSCSAEGIAQSRIDHPLQALVPVEDAGDDDRNEDNPWSRMESLLATASADVRAIELVVRPDDGSLLQRQVHRIANGWRVEVEPADAPPFPLLSTSPALLATRAEAAGEASSALPPAATEHPQRRWSSSTTEAFEFLDRELPEDAKARIVGLRFDDDEIEVDVAAPVAGLEAPYGDSSFDAWGAATSWLYPRDEPPGFGCPIGRSLEQLRQMFLARCTEIPGCNPRTHFSIADYSCSQESGGRWQLYIQSAN